MSKEFVIVSGEKIEVTDGWLDLGDMGIGDISEIKGQKNLTKLHKLNFLLLLLPER